MAIVDGRRIPGLAFHKVKGRKEWLGLQFCPDTRTWGWIGPVVKTDTAEDPRTLQFHYCSGISQPVFLDASTTNVTPDYEGITSSSWKQMPEGWRAAFRDYLFADPQSAKEDA